MGSAKMGLVNEYVVGATRVVERPWPSGPSDAEIETREVPEGLVHAVDPETGQALCGTHERLTRLNTPWQELWRLSYVDGPPRCGRCVRVSIPEDRRQQMIAQFERYLADAQSAGDQRVRKIGSDLLRDLREEPGADA